MARINAYIESMNKLEICGLVLGIAIYMLWRVGSLNYLSYLKRQCFIIKNANI